MIPRAMGLLGGRGSACRALGGGRLCLRVPVRSSGGMGVCRVGGIVAAGQAVEHTGYPRAEGTPGEMVDSGVNHTNLWCAWGLK
ncbi:hypothetical protein GCM10009642_53920 [Nocardiopsis metallicus]